MGQEYELQGDGKTPLEAKMNFLKKRIVLENYLEESLDLQFERYYLELKIYEPNGEKEFVLKNQSWDGAQKYALEHNYINPHYQITEYFQEKF